MLACPPKWKEHLPGSLQVGRQWEVPSLEVSISPPSLATPQGQPDWLGIGNLSGFRRWYSASTEGCRLPCRHWDSVLKYTHTPCCKRTNAINNLLSGWSRFYCQVSYGQFSVLRTFGVWDCGTFLLIFGLFSPGAIGHKVIEEAVPRQTL